MASLDELLTSLFGSLGPVGSLVILVIIFALDAALFPALPEVWIVVTYTYRPTEMLGPVAWAGLLLAMAVAGDVLGTSLLYVAVRRWVVLRRRMPRWLERAMKKWTGFLLVQDERVILMNRAVPVIPMVGAFIATLGWDYRRSMAYVAIGGLAKYAILLYIVFAIGLAYDVATARWITLALVVIVVGLSFVASWLRRRRIESDPAERLERRFPEEEAVSGVVRDAPDRHRPLVRVRQVEQRSLDPSPFRRSETGCATDDGRVREGEEDGLDEIRGQDAIGVDEHQHVSGGLPGPPVPTFAGASSFPLEHDRPSPAADLRGVVRATRIRDEHLVGRNRLVLQRLKEPWQILRFVPGGDDDGDPRSPRRADRGPCRGWLVHPRHAATRRS